MVCHLMNLWKKAGCFFSSSYCRTYIHLGEYISIVGVVVVMESGLCAPARAGLRVDRDVGLRRQGAATAAEWTIWMVLLVTAALTLVGVISSLDVPLRCVDISLPHTWVGIVSG
jgi:hypothetical protein